MKSWDDIVKRISNEMNSTGKGLTLGGGAYAKPVTSVGATRGQNRSKPLKSSQKQL